jgi:hypothetical protein
MGTAIEKSKRRWLRYSIRTLLVAVSLFCVWLGWQTSIVRERRDVRALLRQRKAVVGTNYDPYVLGREQGRLVHPVFTAQPSITWIRAAMGDEGVRCIIVKALSRDEQERVAKAFPEARIYR